MLTRLCPPVRPSMYRMMIAKRCRFEVRKSHYYITPTAERIMQAVMQPLHLLGGITVEVSEAKPELRSVDR